jgi:hypothetical protein
MVFECKTSETLTSGSAEAKSGNVDAATATATATRSVQGRAKGTLKMIS